MEGGGGGVEQKDKPEEQKDKEEEQSTSLSSVLSYYVRPEARIQRRKSLSFHSDGLFSKNIGLFSKNIGSIFT